MKAFLFFFLMLLSHLLFSASLADVLQSVANESLSAENYRLSYENSLISIRSAELDDRAEYSFDAEVSPLYEDAGGVEVGNLSFSVTSADDDTTVTVRSPFAISYDGSGSIYHPGLGIEHTFDFGHDDERLEDLQNQASLVSTERTFRRSILSVQRSVLDISSSIYSVELEISMQQYELGKLRKERDDDIKLGIMSEESIDAAEYDISIKLAEDNLASLSAQLDIYKESFKALTGLDWESYDSIPEPLFPSSLSWSGNSEVEEARLLAEIADETYLVEYSYLHPKSLSLSLDADSTIVQNEVLASNGVDATLSAVWNSDTWSLYASGGGEWTEQDGFIPSLAIGGSWRSDSTKREDELYLETLSNERLLSRNEYIIELSDYRESVLSLGSDIIAWQAEREQQDNEIAYRNALLEQQRAFYDRGLTDEESLMDAEMETERAEKELEILKLEGLSLALSAESLLI